jgi:hypothetical protein
MPLKLTAARHSDYQKQVSDMIKQILRVGLVLNLALLGVSAGLCQNEVIVRETPMKAQTLSGRVQLGDSPDGVKGVLVEDCDSDWNRVLASMQTDEKGHFNFPNASKDKTHYLRLSFHGAHTLQIKVEIQRSGPKELTLILSFST